MSRKDGNVSLIFESVMERLESYGFCTVRSFENGSYSILDSPVVIEDGIGYIEVHDNNANEHVTIPLFATDVEKCVLMRLLGVLGKMFDKMSCRSPYSGAYSHELKNYISSLMMHGAVSKRWSMLMNNDINICDMWFLCKNDVDTGKVSIKVACHDDVFDLLSIEYNPESEVVYMVNLCIECRDALWGIFISGEIRSDYSNRVRKFEAGYDLNLDRVSLTY